MSLLDRLGLRDDVLEELVRQIGFGLHEALLVLDNDPRRK